MPASAVASVRCRGLTKQYSELVVLEPLDLDIQSGETFCLVGANGSGKSTLLEMMMGLRRPSGGQLMVLGEKPDSERLKGKRAMLLDRASFPYYARVKEIVWLHSGFYPQPADSKALLTYLELDPNKFIRHLSKGQRQRLGLLLTLLGSPQLLLLDEPASGLDPPTRVRLWQLLQGRIENQAQRPTVVFATHDLTEAERWSDRVAIFHQGRILDIDSPHRLRERIIGVKRKLVLPEHLPEEESQVSGVHSIMRLGHQTILYTDIPEDILSTLSLVQKFDQIQIAAVDLQDVYFRLTGETEYGTPAIPWAKSA